MSRSARKYRKIWYKQTINDPFATTRLSLGLSVWIQGFPKPWHWNEKRDKGYSFKDLDTEHGYDRAKEKVKWQRGNYET